jgi:hypothetical protein
MPLKCLRILGGGFFLSKSGAKVGKKSRTKGKKKSFCKFVAFRKKRFLVEKLGNQGNMKKIGNH